MLLIARNRKIGTKNLQIIMLSKQQTSSQLSFYSTFEEQLNHQHPLYILANKINWEVFQKAYSKLYSEEGRPAKPIRLMVSLLLLKHIRNLSDESIVEQWAENYYYQYFQFFVIQIQFSEISEFKNTIQNTPLKFYQYMLKFIFNEEENKKQETFLLYF